MQNTQPSESIPTTILSFIRKVARPYQAYIWAIVFVDIIWAAEHCVRPYLVKIILDRLSTTESAYITEALLTPACSYIGLSLMTFCIFRIYDYANLKLFPPMGRDINALMTTYINKHSQSYFQNNFAGGLANKVANIYFAVERLIIITCDRFFGHGLILIFSIITLLTVSYVVAAIFLCWAIIFIAITSYAASTIHQLSHNLSETYTDMTGKMVDTFSNSMAVRLFGRQEHEQRHLGRVFQEAEMRDQKLRWFTLKLYAAQGMSFIIMNACCLTYLIWGYRHDLLSIGDFALSISITISVIDHLWELAKDLSEFAEHMGKMSQGLAITTSPIEIVDRPQAKPLQVSKGEIAFKEVGFWFKGSKPLFNHLNVTIPAGQKVGLVGYSGSGKTTFVNLILRQFETQLGQILIDGQDISEVTLDSLRQQIALIPQDPSLFHRTLMDNIRYGKIDATAEEIVNAAKAAHAHDFILQLQDGYNTMVGERGAKISGGQRQRIAVARAILKNAPILILDEATSALDSVTEGYIQDSLHHLMQDKTVLVVAHRLSTLQEMDRILVFEKGVLVEDGSHTTLLHRKGTYATLWNSQVNGFITDAPLQVDI